MIIVVILLLLALSGSIFFMFHYSGVRNPETVEEILEHKNFYQRFLEYIKTTKKKELELFMINGVQYEWENDRLKDNLSQDLSTVVEELIHGLNCAFSTSTITLLKEGNVETQELVRRFLIRSKNIDIIESMKLISPKKCSFTIGVKTLSIKVDKVVTIKIPYSE